VTTARGIPSPTLRPQLPAPKTWPLARVLGSFALASGVVLAAAWGLRSLLGLPDWFFPAAVVLLAVGLPIVLLAARVHNRRALRPAGTATPASGGFRGSLTLRRAVTGGVAAFAGLGLVTAGYMAMRSFGIGPVGTLVASGKLAERERLIIADFTNTTRDSMLGPAVTQAFRVDFSQSKLVSPVEADYVRRVLRRMQVADSLPVNLALAREIAERQGWKAVVAGELQQVGPSLLISAQLVNAQSGEVLATARHTARDSTAILDAVDRVSKQLRERIGESLRSIRGNAPLAEVTTGSLEALRKYSQALRAENAGDRRGTIARLEEAVAADTGFAMAWRKLGVVLFNEGERQSQAAEAVTRAFRLRERLTFRERKLTENSYYSDVVGDLDSAAAAVGSILAEYPGDSWAFNNLGVISFFQGDLPAAVAAYRQSVKLEPENALALGNVFSAEISQGKFDAAAATLQSIRDRFPPGPAVSELGLVMLLSRRDFVGAEAEITRQLAQYRGNPIVQLKLQRMLAGVLTIRGKLSEADRLHLAVAEQLALRGQEGVALEELARRASPAAIYRGDSALARARLDEAFRRIPLDRVPEHERPLSILIRIASDAGDRSRTEALIRDFERSPGDSPGRVRNYLRSLSRATVLGMRTETIPQALAAYRRMPEVCRYCVHFKMAEAFDRSGMPDSALVYYQRWADDGEGNWAPVVYTVWQPLGWFRLAELYQARGDKERARYYYGRFIDTWQDADQGLQPKVREARNRIKELVAEPAN
jgi:tetratricopeptide (TPR) repeat protein